MIDAIGFGGATGKAGLDLDLEVTGVPGAGDRPRAQLMPLPALVALGLILWLQRRRSPTLAPATATVAAAGD